MVKNTRSQKKNNVE